MKCFKKDLIILIFLIFFFNSCEKECQCDKVVYESNLQNNYNWTEISRDQSSYCEIDTLSSVFLDSIGNISYVKTIVECIN